MVLLERHSLTAGTTWHAAGLITSAGMADETSLFMARYSRDLYARLEAETGHSTGFREVGHILLASTPERVEVLRRAGAWQHGFGVPERFGCAAVGERGARLQQIQAGELRAGTGAQAGRRPEALLRVVAAGQRQLRLGFDQQGFECKAGAATCRQNL